MQLESLQIFCDIARYRSFSRAAEANRITQSAVSQIAHQLERRLGVQLINRSTRPLQLTTVGRTFYEGCQTLIEQYAELEAGIRNQQAAIAAHVRVAAIYSVSLGDMGEYVARFRTLLPNADVQVEYLHPDQVTERVLDGSADFGMVSFPRPGRLLVAAPWREEEMVLACAPSHPLARLRSIKPAQLAAQRFIGFDRNLQIRREIDRFLRQHGIALQVVAAFDNIENIKKAVEDGAGVALLPEPTLRREVQAATLVAVPLVGVRLVRPLAIIHKRHHSLSAAALRFIELLQQSPADRHRQSLPDSSGRNGAAHPARTKSRVTPM